MLRCAVGYRRRDVVSLGGQLATWRGLLVPSSAGSCLTLQMKANDGKTDPPAAPL